MENDISIIIIAFAIVLFLAVGGTLLAEIAVWIGKMLGYDFDEPNVDFMQRLENGETLDAENMFSNE